MSMNPVYTLSEEELRVAIGNYISSRTDNTFTIKDDTKIILKNGTQEERPCFTDVVVECTLASKYKRGLL